MTQLYIIPFGSKKYDVEAPNNNKQNDINTDVFQASSSTSIDSIVCHKLYSFFIMLNTIHHLDPSK